RRTQAGPLWGVRKVAWPMNMSFPASWTVLRWRLWSHPRPAVADLLGIEVAAVLATVLLSVQNPVTGQNLRYFGIVVALGLLAAEATRGVERMRRWFSSTPHVNMSSVWTLSAALLTSPALAAATAVI